MVDNEQKSAEGEQNKEGIVEEKKEEGLSIREIKETIEENKKILSAITEERKKIEKATAEILVNGRSYAGQTPVKPKEESPKEYKDRIMRGN